MSSTAIHSASRRPGMSPTAIHSASGGPGRSPTAIHSAPRLESRSKWAPDGPFEQSPDCLDPCAQRFGQSRDCLDPCAQRFGQSWDCLDPCAQRFGQSRDCLSRSPSRARRGHVGALAVAARRRRPRPTPRPSHHSGRGAIVEPSTPTPTTSPTPHPRTPRPCSSPARRLRVGARMRGQRTDSERAPMGRGSGEGTPPRSRSRLDGRCAATRGRIGMELRLSGHGACAPVASHRSRSGDHAHRKTFRGIREELPNFILQSSSFSFLMRA